MTKTNRPFNKTYNTPTELVKLLQSRGLFIGDADLAAHYIQNIGYYRLSPPPPSCASDTKSQ